VNDTTVMHLVARVLDTGCAPEVVCRDAPELLAQVREQLRLIRSLDAHVESVFPSSDSVLMEDASLQRGEGDGVVPSTVPPTRASPSRAGCPPGSAQ
jgi:hypothetical protein